MQLIEPEHEKRDQTSLLLDCEIFTFKISGRK